MEYNNYRGERFLISPLNVVWPAAPPQLCMAATSSALLGSSCYPAWSPRSSQAHHPLPAVAALFVGLIGVNVRPSVNFRAAPSVGRSFMLHGSIFYSNRSTAAALKTLITALSSHSSAVAADAAADFVDRAPPREACVHPFLLPLLPSIRLSVLSVSLRCSPVGAAVAWERPLFTSSLPSLDSARSALSRNVRLLITRLTEF